MSPRWAAAAGRHRRPSGHLHHGLRDLRDPRPLRDGPGQAGQALRFLVEPAARLHGQLRMGPAAAIRERHRGRGPAVEQIRPQDPFLEPARAQERADHRPGREPPDGAGNPARARPGQGLRLLRRGGGHHQPAGRDLHLVAKDDGTFEAKKTITIDPRPRRPRTCRRCCRASRPCRRWSPTSTSASTTVPLRRLLGLGEMRQYDVSDPMNPKLAGKVEIGGIAQGHGASQRQALRLGPQMVEISRDGKRVYWTNSLYSTWDDQFYPDDEGGQMVMANVGENGGLSWTRISMSSSQRATAATRSGWRAATARPTASATRPSDVWRRSSGNGPLVGRCRLGLYHGVNPGMGWPLAVSAALMDRRGAASSRRWALAGWAPAGDGGDPVAVHRAAVPRPMGVSASAASAACWRAAGPSASGRRRNRAGSRCRRGFRADAGAGQ
jgi:hypothetical protein